MFLSDGNAVTRTALAAVEHRRALGLFDRVGLSRGQRRAPPPASSGVMVPSRSRR
jgi:hypothetical protein